MNHQAPQPGSPDDEPQKTPGLPDTDRNEEPVGTRGPNDDPEGRGEDERKGRQSAEDESDPIGGRASEPGHGTSNGAEAPEPQNPH